jgi:Flp pilus assembly protein TadD
MPKANHFVPPLLVLFLGCTALSGGAQAGWFDSGKPKPAPVQPDAKEKAPPSPSANLDESIRQATLLRLAGSYPEAVKHLSQLMMVAADDPRVVSEYGKTLAQMGRASDAVNFLTRAEQLSPTDWTVYSALGFAYDQIGNQKQAQTAYEHALVLKPGEPSVLNNYALSRLQAQDTAMAYALAAKAESANASLGDEKIARNIAMIRSMAPETPVTAVAASKPAPAKSETSMAKAAPASQSFVPVAQQDLPHMPPPSASKVSLSPLPTPESRVVMQRVPVDPLAGPVASHPPRPLQPASKPELTASRPEPKAEAPKLAAKPDAKPDAKTADTKVAQTKSAEAKPVVKLDIAPPKNEPAKPETKPVGKSSIPGLRLSANAF